MNGILLIDKPIGITSHDVVAKVRSMLRQEIRNQKLENSLVPSSSLLVSTPAKPKVGHTGTLDPLASGLMILVLGSYTKRAGEFSGMDKTYEAEITLGKVSATGDSEGPITGYRGQDIGSREEPSEEIVRGVLRGFEGKISQMPPAHSAKKIGGQRAYKLARAGKEVKLEPREVTIYSITDVKFAYPQLNFTVKVSSGTYIRSLAEDIGAKLDTGAYLSALRRTSVGQFDIEAAMDLENADLHHLMAQLKTEVVK